MVLALLLPRNCVYDSIVCVYVRSYFSSSSESLVAQSLLRQDGEGYCDADSAGLNDLEDMFGEVKAICEEECH